MTTLLQRGSTGAAVRDLQLLLNASAVGAGLDADSNFGAATERAVLAFQKWAGLVEDGRAGAQTITALQNAIAPIIPGQPEPDKSAMSGKPIVSADAGDSKIAPPPNIGTLVLLDTARPIDEIIIHCTATPEGRDYSVADIRAWHKLRGFTDVGYHYILHPDGRIDLGRPVGQIGSHVAGHNTGTIGISYIGGLTADGKSAKDTRTAVQRSSLLWLVAALKAKHKGIRKVTGHNQYANKACPCFSVPADPLGRVA